MPKTEEMTQRQMRDLYGTPMEPIICTKVLVKDMENFDHDHVHTQCWVLIDERDDTRIHVNSYDGKLGRKYRGNSKRYDWDAEKDLKKYKKKGYEEVPVDQCPFAAQPESDE